PQRLGSPDEAIAAYLAAVKRDPACADAFYNMAILRAQRDQVREAERCYRAALDIEPAHVAALFNLALLLTRQERYQDALPLWDKVASLDADRQDALRARRSAQLCRMAVHAIRSGS
ncbi:tetratricopeptide repeat protein, partial [Nostoc sp. NIES-2111]